MPSPSTPSTFDRDVRDAAVTLPANHLVCRDLGHQWHPSGVITRDSNGFFRRPLLCGTCGTVRVDKMTSSGIVYGRTYTYPDGYALPGLGHKVHNRAAFRRVMLERTDYLDLNSGD